MTDTKIHAPITLSTGAIVLHKPYGNGATEAYLENGRNMTDAEWIEYCKILHAETASANKN